MFFTLQDSFLRSHFWRRSRKDLNPPQLWFTLNILAAFRICKTSQFHRSAAVSVSSSSISWWSSLQRAGPCLLLLSVLLLHFCLTSPRLIYSAACTAHRSAGLFSVWACTFLFVLWDWFIEPICDVSIILQCSRSSRQMSSWCFDSLSCLCPCEWFLFLFLSVGDFLSPSIMEQQINKQLSNSSAALHSPERGKRGGGPEVQIVHESYTSLLVFSAR